MSATVPRVPRRGAGAGAPSDPPDEPAGEGASGAGRSPGCGGCGPVVVLTAPWCRVRLSRADPARRPDALPRAPARYDAPTLPSGQPG
ncbi:MAG TPA: hypothetical protein VEV65_00840, partial [Kineosporiaceae bacterium]|nr:hypothetical protein [Kineosporiaceae bacterium]